MEIPILPLRNAVLFPGLVMPLMIGRKKTLELIKTVEQQKNKDEEVTIGVLTQRDKDVQDPEMEDLFTMGTIATVLKFVKRREHGMDIVIQGSKRFRVLKFTQTVPFLKAEIEIIEEDNSRDIEIEALVQNLKTVTSNVLSLIPDIPNSASGIVEDVVSPNRLVYLIASNLPIQMEEKFRILETVDLKQSLRELIRILNRQIEVLKVTEKINSEVKGELNRNQREFVLRQQLKAIQKELGEIEEESDVLEELRLKIEKVNMPAETKRVAEKELRRLRSIQPASPEYTVSRTYLDWMVDFPWAKETKDLLDVTHAKEVLDVDHYDLEKIKKRILEYLAVSQLRKGLKGPILCLVGPPGVGKTSLGHSIAKALGREFIRISLGGVRDEAEIRGHRRTYIGALPGKIIQGIKRAGSINPVFMMDEVDKLGRDWRGDPTSALLEVLDPEQNSDFMDHYLDVPVDLSKVLFITTANVTDTIPAPLLDRMELLELPGYTHYEKIQIAHRHLLPKQIKEHGLAEYKLSVPDDIIGYIIDRYTRESGVRNMERSIAGLCRGIAVQVVKGKWNADSTITTELVENALGLPKFKLETGDRSDIPGIATGLAWTAAGGVILFVEATKMEGKGRLKLTGHLGDVMKESAQIALSYLQSKANVFNLDPKVFESIDIHIHVPAGAIPKDGPSAGITMFMALYSLLANKLVRKDTAMTGEITLRGSILPVGGIKNKVLAAQRGGVKRLVIPAENENDLIEIPDEIKKSMEFVLVKDIDDALKAIISDNNPKKSKKIGDPKLEPVQWPSP